MNSDSEPHREDSDTDFSREILRAASRHDTSLLKRLLKGPSAGPANVRGLRQRTPLHEAVAACERNQAATSTDSEDAAVKDYALRLATSKSDGDDAVATVELLLQNGAIWNALDENDETPGCIAARLELPLLYQIMVNAGVRTEALLNHLSELERPEDTENDLRYTTEGAAIPTLLTDDAPELPSPDPSGREDRSGLAAIKDDSVAATDNAKFLQSKLHYNGNDKLVESHSKLAVMMSWEANIMKESAKRLTGEGVARPRILNVGHGLGIIDQEFQSMLPSSHHIIEAHCDVQDQMRASGWNTKPGIQVHEGRWQDEVPKLVEQGILFDVVYFDTYAEDYQAFKLFFDTYLPAILSDNGRFGFFNGLGADRQVCYDVYQKIVEMDLLEAGFEVTFTETPTPSALRGATWNGLIRPYWRLAQYRLPVARFLQG